MAKIISFRSDKQMASFSGPKGDPETPSKRIKITVKVLDENSQPVSVPIIIGSSEGPETIRYFDSDFQPIPLYQDAYIRVQTRAGSGEVDVYLCASYLVLFSLLARIDGTNDDYRSVDLLFYEFGLKPAEGLSAPNLSLANGVLTIPPWERLDYAASANTSLPPTAYRTAAIVCNDYVRIRDPSIISSDLQVPYDAMLTHGLQSSLGYVVRTVANTLPSPTLTFVAAGQGLVMPDPAKGATYPAPQWQYGDISQMTTWDIVPDLTLNITLVNGVQEGDTYEVNVYLNGYDTSSGLCRPPAPVQVYTIKAPAGAKAGQQVPCRIPKKNLLGYARNGPYNWGYMWADCLVTSAALSYASVWTMPWGPILIDFFDY